MLGNAKQAGVALVLVLWITVLLTIMAGAFTLTLQREAKLITNLKAHSEANALAEAGLYHALLMLTLKDPDFAWKVDGNIHEVPFGGGVVRIEVGDERGKIDLNVAGREMLAKVFTSIEVEPSAADKLADAILDWRDANDDVHLNGAEKKEYQQQNLPYKPRNAPFQSVEELQFVLGMTPQLFKVVEPMLTVYAQAAVDKTKASPAVVRILQALADDATNSRNTKADADAGTAEGSAAASDGETNTESDVEADTETSAGSGGQADGSDGISKGASFGSGAYSIDATAFLPNGYTGRIRVVVRRGQDGASLFDILSWKDITTRSNRTSLEKPGSYTAYY